ncbi:galactose oxidase-like domain-containing protein, partial [Croceivirga lutea]|uniref:galactose oxidase-like domain-containing protein n=1 Tax=Croceivirga lutea TaxID=1775167 RepID=UPI0016395521
MKIAHIFHVAALGVMLLFSSLSYSQNQAQDGSWGNPITFGIVPVAVANLPDGRLLTWSSQFRNTFTTSGNGFTYSQYFDPFGGINGTGAIDGPEFTINTNHDMFCPGINNLADGRILSAGGTSSEKTSIFDWRTGLWEVADTMNIPRGYQGNVTLADGSVFTVGGSWSGGAWTNRDAEVWTEAAGWRLMNNIKGDDFYTSNDLLGDSQSTLYRADNHIWLWPAPDGSLFHAGPSELMHWINTSGNGTMISAGTRNSDGFSMKGTTVMFDVGKILKVGGAESYDDGDVANENSYVIDINGGYGSNPTVTKTNNDLQYPRTMHNSTVLPNGEVLVTGGLSESLLFTDSGARLSAEIYDPSTNSWRTVAGMQVPRTYHSVAILMVDGRVFVGGGGLCNTTPGCVNHFDAEIYSPPYLFNGSGNLATRPTITAPEAANYNSTIQVSGSNGIQEFSLIRFSAATHSTNNEQRRIPVQFSNNGGSYNVNIPNQNLLPPGYYMLFALDDNGVPSIAETIQIGQNVVVDEPDPSDPDLIVSLNFEESNGNQASDDSGYNNDFTIVERDDNGNAVTANDHTWNASGVFGNAIEFDGRYHNSNSILEVPLNGILDDVANEITVSAWVWRDAESIVPEYRGGLPANVAVFAHDYPAMFAGFHNWLIKWSFGTTNGFVDCYAGHAPLNQWTHVAVTYDGQTARLYSNGVEICNKPLTGTISLRNDSTPNSRFTASGFYEHRTNLPVIPSGNRSAITDELDGRLDDFKIYRRALTSSEISGLYQEGLNTGTPGIPDCTVSQIVPEFKIGPNGNWTTGNLVTAPYGSQIFIRAKNYNGEYIITTPAYDGPTISSANNTDRLTNEGAYQIDTYIYNYGDSSRNNGVFDQYNVGQYALTTLQGCSTVIDVQVGEISDCNIDLIPEYRINGVWDSGENELTVASGTEVLLSFIPNNINFTIQLPDGSIVSNDYNLGNVEVSDSGTYTFNTNQGCTAYLNLIVNEPIGNQNPVANPGQDQTLVDNDGSGDEEVTLSGSSSFDSDGTITTYEWYQNDNLVGTGINLTLSLDVGIHNFSLKVIDNEGAENTSSNTVQITILEQGTPISCPDYLENDDPIIVLPEGQLVAGMDVVAGTNEETNGSYCGVAVTNTDTGQPWSRYRLPIVLADHGISAGDDLFIGIDGNDGTGNARVEIVQNNTPNSALGSSNFGSSWSRYET